MRTFLKSVAVAALVAPLAAYAAIANTRHDMASGSATTGPKSGGATPTDQTCIFCHSPHKVARQSLLWNRTPTGDYAFSAGQTTLKGTPYPSTTATINSETKACLSCHDGTSALNALANPGPGGTPTMTANVVGAAYDVIATTTLDTNHPVSMPYPITGSDPEYRNPVTAGCTNSSGVCTGAAPGSTNIQLYGTAPYRIECGSCHEPHGRYVNAFFLRETTATSTICKACHIK